jgi:hypothetical protein
MSGPNPVSYGAFSLTHGQTLGTMTIDDDNIWQLTNIVFEDMGKREDIECTNMNVQNPTAGFGNKIHLPSMYAEGGTIKATSLWDPTYDPSDYISDHTDVGWHDFVINWGPCDTAQEQLSFIGYVADLVVDGPLDGKPMTAIWTIKSSADDSYGEHGAVEVVPSI